MTVSHSQPTQPELIGHFMINKTRSQIQGTSTWSEYYSVNKRGIILCGSFILKYAMLQVCLMTILPVPGLWLDHVWVLGHTVSVPS